MPHCVASNCTNHSGRNKKAGVSFHVFPCDDVRLSEWLVNIQREGFEPQVASRLCSKHLTGYCFDRSGFRVMLSKNAVPTIFTEVIPWVIFSSASLAFG